MFNKDELLKELLKHKRIAETVNELKLTKEQMYDAIPIMIDMSEEVDNEKTLSLTTIIVNKNGSIKRGFVNSTKGEELAFIDNIVTQDINYINFDDDDFIKEDGRKDVVNAFAKVLSGESNKGLYIYGEMGIGKTFMLKRFAQKAAKDLNKKVGFVNLSNLISSIKKTFNSTEDNPSILDRLIKADYLFIDDIGAEKVSAWFRDDFLFTLLNERMDKKKITFFTSNYSIDELQMQESKTAGSKYLDKDNAKRLISRVRALTTQIKVNGTNKRY